jgi:hypothetical protein
VALVRDGGYAHVAAYLAAYELSGFRPQDPPPKTAAFYAIVDANIPPECVELQNAIDHMRNPDAFTLDDLREHAIGELEEWLNGRRNRRALPHRLGSRGYVPVRNPDAKTGLWKIDQTWQTIYAKNALNLEQRLSAARKRRRKRQKDQKSE